MPVTATPAVTLKPVVVATELPTPKNPTPPFMVAVQTNAVGVAVQASERIVPVVAVPPTIEYVPRSDVHVAVEQVADVTPLPGVAVAVVPG